MESNYNQLATAQEIDEKIKNIATEILNDFPNHSPLFVSLLRGANQFTAKLMFEIVRQNREYHPDVDYMMVSTYGSGQHASTPHIVTDLAPSTNSSGREVIILDDVLDKGVTAHFVQAHLLDRGANSVKLAVLCDKTTSRQYPIEADYKGFTFSDNWLVGMGMDDANTHNEGYRWLDEIWEIKR